MALEQKAFKLTRSILAYIDVPDPINYTSDIHIMILSALAKTYVRARRDAAAGRNYDETVLYVYPNLMRPKLPQEKE
ncbi:hypothetical protein ES703_101324 [subsurface metagenome]